MNRNTRTIHTTPVLLACTLAAIALVALPAHRPARAADPPPAVTFPQGRWVNISDPTIQKLKDEGKKEVWPGGTAGVAADPGTGDVYMIATGYGVWKSSDRGRTFSRVDGGNISGRCETGYALNIDPAGGGRLACFMLDGKGGLTADGGKTWHPFQDVGRNWDYAAVLWPGGGGDHADRGDANTAGADDGGVQHIFAALHESGGKVYASHDAGRSWSHLFTDPEFDKTGGLGIFDEKTLVYTRKGKGIQRSTDAGQTWAKVADAEPVGRVVRVHRGVGYWLTTEGLLVSRDQGATWSAQGRAAPAATTLGPYLDPKEPNHMVAAGARGIFETTDGGDTWEPVAPLPAGFTMPKAGWFANVTWDPLHDVVYASQMGKPTFRWERGPG
jgi:hypothetical protein